MTYENHDIIIALAWNNEITGCMYVMSMYSTYYPNFRSDIDMNYKESSLNLQPTQDLMNQAYKVSGVPLTKNPQE